GRCVGYAGGSGRGAGGERRVNGGRGGGRAVRRAGGGRIPPVQQKTQPVVRHRPHLPRGGAPPTSIPHQRVPYAAPIQPFLLGGTGIDGCGSHDRQGRPDRGNTWAPANGSALPGRPATTQLGT